MPIYLTLIPRSQEKRAEGVLSLNGAVFNAIKSKRRLSMVLKNGRSLVFKPALVAELPQWQQAFQVAGVAPAAVSAKPRGSSSSSLSRTCVSARVCVSRCASIHDHGNHHQGFHHTHARCIVRSFVHSYEQMAHMTQRAQA